MLFGKCDPIEDENELAVKTNGWQRGTRGMHKLRNNFLKTHFSENSNATKENLSNKKKYNDDIIATKMTLPFTYKYSLSHVLEGGNYK